MTKAEAKMRLLAEWRTWIGHRGVTGSATKKDAADFFLHIQFKHPELVSFDGAEPSLVTDWLHRAGLIVR